MSTRQQKKVRYVKCPKCVRILPEPEQVPLYTCGSCNTVLQAKYYRRDNEATVPTLPAEDVVQNNGNGPTSEVQESSGSSQNSPIKKEEIDEETDDDYNFEQFGGGISAHQLFGVLGSKGGKKVLISPGELGETSHEDKEAKQLPMENETKGDGSDQDQYDGIAFDKQGDEQVREVNDSRETSTARDVELPEDRKSQQRVTVNEVKEDENDEQQSEDIAFDKQKQVGHENSANESSRSIPSEPTEKPEQFEPVNLTEGRRVSGNVISCLAVDEPVEVTILGKEDNSGKEPKSFIERIKAKLASVTSSNDAPLSTEVQEGTDNSLSGVEGNLGTHAVGSVSDVPHDRYCGISLLGGVTETSRPEIENFDGSDFSRPGEFVDSSEKVGNLVEEVSQDRDGELSLPDNVTETSRPKSENINDSDLNGSGEFVDINEKFDHLLKEVPQEISLLDEGTETSRPEIENFDDSDFNRSGEFVDSSKKVGNLPEEVPQDLDSAISLLDKETETSRPKMENFVNSNFNRSGEFADDTNEKGGNLVEKVTRSPIKRSPAYDGSVSSFDGNEDRIPGQLEHLNGQTFSENDAVAAYIGIPSSRRKHSSSRTRAQEQEQESVRENEIWAYNRFRQHKNSVFPPRIPDRRRSSDMAFDTGSSSSYVRDEGPRHWTRQHRRENETYGQWGYTEGRRFPETAWRENDFRPPMYYSDDISGEIHHGYSDRIRRAESRSLSGNLPRIRFSGEVYDGRNQFHNARPWSAHLPSGVPWRAPRGAYYRHGPVAYMDPLAEATWDPYDPYLKTWQRYLEFESYGASYDPVYLSDKRHKDWITKRSYVREKQQAMKQRLRPMAGGAPFMTCSLCFRILQLPEEFLVSKRKKIHRLKCGVCFTILEFSLENESCLAPRLPSAVEDDREIQSIESQSHKYGKDLHQHNSFRALGTEKSNSRTGERVEVTNDAAFSSDQPRQVGVTWRLPSRSKSPLHRLMGYSSPHDLLTEHSGYSS